MSSDCIIFIHRGESWYLYYTVKQARYYHPDADIVVISDVPQKGIRRYADVVSISKLWSGAAEISTIYEHHSVNSPEFELFCFQRWFVIRDFLGLRKPERCIYLDSDVLVYENLFKDFARLGDASLGIVGFQGTFSMLIPNAEVVQLFCERVLRLYREERESLSRLYAEWTKKDPYVAVSDMHALHTFIAEHRLSTLDLSVRFEGTVYDTVIHECDGVEMRDGLKAIFWISEKPYVKSVISGRKIRLKTIHCQGDSKSQILNLFNARDPSFYYDKYAEAFGRLAARLGSGGTLRRTKSSAGKSAIGGGRMLVYFGHIPAEGTGSPVILYRHLLRLWKKGWKIIIVGEWGQEDSVAKKHRWPVISLSHRKTFWPPFRPDSSILRSVRIRLWASEVNNLMSGQRPDAVLTYLSAFSDTLSLAAVGYSQNYGIPLTTISHDDVRCFTDNSKNGLRAHARHDWILRNSTFALFASDELAAGFSCKRGSMSVLPPIPEGWQESAQWRLDKSNTKFRVVYAGTIWPAQYSLLAEISNELQRCGGGLTLIAKLSPELQAFIYAGHAEWVAPFPANRDALDYMVKNATGLLVSYSKRIEDMPWIASSFPSKLIEYSHLGLPCAIVAPPQSAVGRWATREGYPDYFAPSEMETFADWARSLTCPKSWRVRAQSLRKYADGVFNPDLIQEQFERAIS